jgi:hypothetical protein
MTAPPLDFPPNTAFPAAPTVGQHHPVPGVPGQPVYTWDGVKWTTYGGTIDSGGAGTALPLMDADVALVGLSTKYAREDHVHPKFPVEDALAYNGLQINGAFDVSQEKGSATTGSTGYICDGWRLTKTLGGTGVVTFKQFPVPGVFPNAMSNQLVGSVSTIQATLGATDVVSVSQRIEGYRIARLGWGGISPQSITIGFWSANTPAGIYSISVHNSLDDRSYTTSYTQIAASVQQYNVITIPGEPNGNWDVTIGVGIEIIFTFSAGTGAQTSSPGQWFNGSATIVAGQVNGLSSVANSIKLAQVIVLPGVVPLPSSSSALVMRPYSQELALCRRYWQKHIVVVDTPAAYQSWAFPVEFRTNPAVTGGGSGFAVNSPNTQTATFSQTSRAIQTLSLDARL